MGTLRIQNLNQRGKMRRKFKVLLSATESITIEAEQAYVNVTENSVVFNYQILFANNREPEKHVIARFNMDSIVGFIDCEAIR
jgi:hypothetical protein